jgi:hypothetical protein
MNAEFSIFFPNSYGDCGLIYVTKSSVRITISDLTRLHDLRTADEGGKSIGHLFANLLDVYFGIVKHHLLVFGSPFSFPLNMLIAQGAGKVMDRKHNKSKFYQSPWLACFSAST